MFGTNPIRPPEKGDGSALKIVEIFPTLQGEGPFVGQPSVFVRLGGCNLACDFCDTEFENFSERSLSDILETINALAIPHPHGFRRDLVVITGGEPFRQEIRPLCVALLAAGFRVQIETNGTVWRHVPEAVDIVCSPKVTQGRYHPLRPDLLARISALKFIVSTDHPDYRNVGDVGQGERPIPIYVQPMDVGDETRNAANRAHAVALALTHGYRLSLQTHKLLGIA